ncbi:MAG: glycosyl hydrolase family 28-related protein [Verrucomicrobiota bacterium]
MKKYLLHSVVLFLAVATSSGFAQDRQIPMHVVYPSGAFESNGGPVINITNTTLFSPNAVGDGVTDDTAAFIAMMDYLKGLLASTNNADPRLTIYLPDGTYLVSDTIIHSGSYTPRGFSYLRMVGESRANTIIKLKNNSSGFGSGQQKPVITWTKYWESYQGNVLWGNQLRNITIDTGSGNPGAVGVAFFGANGCSIDNLTVRSGDGQGYCGLRFPGWSVQGHFSDITIDGFDYGIRAESRTETNPVLEYVSLQNQNVNGIYVGRSTAAIRRLDSDNSVPGLVIGETGAHVVIVDSAFSGGNTGNAALTLDDSAVSQLFARNVSVAGYGTSIKMDGSAVQSGNVDEWLSGTVFRHSTDTPPKTMNLAVEEAQLVPWESNPANWASPEDYSGNDAQKIQAALNSGKPAVYFPRTYNAGGATLTVPASVRQLEFLHQKVNSATFRLNESSPNGLWLEHPQNRLPVHVNAARTVHVRFGSVRYRVLTSEPVVAHFQTLAVLADGHLDAFCPPNARIYMRSPNEEANSRTNFRVNGGLAWVLGFKTERPRPAFEVDNGGFLEVLGGYQNFAGANDQGFPTVINNESNVSYIATNFMTRTYQEGIWEMRDGQTLKFRNPDFPRRNSGTGSGNYFVPLYVGYDPSLLDGPGDAHVLVQETFEPGTDVTGQSSFEQIFLVEFASNNKWDYASSGGVGNGGRIEAPVGQQVSAVHQSPLPPFVDGGSLTFSLDTKISFRTSNEPGFAINWGMMLKNQLTHGPGGLKVELRYVPPSSRTPSEPERFQVWIDNQLVSGVEFTDDNWYWWEVTWTLTDASADLFDAEVNLYALGPDGTGTPLLHGTYIVQNIDDATMAGATAVYAGIDGRARNNTGVFSVDNFTVSTGDDVIEAMQYETFNAGSDVDSQTTFESTYLVELRSNNQWDYSGAGGLDNSGRLDAPSGQTVSVIHRDGLPAFVEGAPRKFTLSAQILHQTTGEPGFSINWSMFFKDQLTDGSGGLKTELRYVSPANRTPAEPERFQVWAGGQKVGTIDFPEDEWFILESTWTLENQATGEFSGVVDIYSIGAAGDEASTLLGTYSASSVFNSTMANASSAYAGMSGRSRDGTGVSRVDEWIVTGE